MANEYDFQNSSDVNMFREYEGVFSGNGGFNVGKTTVRVYGALRFTGINVAQGTTVNDATLHIYVEDRGSGSGDCKIQYWGIDEDNTSDFSASPFGRDKTTASHSPDVSVTSPPGWQNLSCTSEVNEILARGGWSSGNAMGFIFNPRDGTPDNRYMLDMNTGASTNSYLTIVTTVRPDFYPSPSTATSDPNPDKRNSYGIKVAKEGYDARTATDQQLAFSSSWRVLKAQFFGLENVPADDVLSVPHNLGYKGAFLVFGSIVDGATESNKFKFPAIVEAIGKDPTRFVASQSNTTLTAQNIPFVQNGDQPEMNVYYYIFVDDIDL